MDNKYEIAKDWLPRYTGMPVDKFGDYILLTNFQDYVEEFANQFDCDIQGKNRPMSSCTNDSGLSIINFGIGSPNAATVMDLLVDRSDPKSRFEVYGKANEMLKRGYNVCIFPESHYMDDTILLADFKRGAFKIAIDNNLPIIPLVFYDLKLKHPWYPKFGSLGKLRVKVLDKISVDGLKEEDIPMLTKKAFDTIKVELENDPKKAAVRATEKWKKILA